MQTADELEATAPVHAAHMRARATASLKHFLRGRKSVELSRAALELMRAGGGDDPRVPVMHLQSLVRVGAGDEARALMAECAATVVKADDASLRVNVAEAFFLQDDLETADALLERWLGPARANGDVSDLANGIEWSARHLQARGDLGRAHAAALESLELNKLLPDEVLQTAESTVRVHAVLCAIGSEDQAEPWFTRALELSRRCSSSFLEAQVYAAGGGLALSHVRTEDAVEDLERVREMVRGGGYRHPAFVQFSPELVEAYVRAGRTQDARAEQAELNAEAQLVQTAWALAVAARCRGLLEPMDSDEAFEEALAQHAKSPRVLEKGRTQLAYGERLRRAGQRVRAREQLRAALEIFETCGAVAWADRARQELRSSGETTRAADTAREELSPQELQVALIVAEGASNKEAAARLFLSPKTIEFHLRNVFRKLGVRSRVEVANVMRGTHTASAAEHLEAQL
jgi:DNA-binding CsgD family transcriptional regulator